MAIYLDCNATAPIEPRVLAAMRPYFEEEFGNAGSQSHEFGNRARQAIQTARRQVAEVTGSHTEDVIFTSGATESNNLAILGLESAGRTTNRMHLVTTSIEHKAVLEPMAALQRRGFEISIVPVDHHGHIDPGRLAEAIRADTILVSVMQVNNETGIRQPIGEICELLRESEVLLHVDAAQGYGKEPAALQDKRIDLISVSGHKVYAAKGVGALIMRRRGGERAPLAPLMFGGGQERGLRPGTLPVALIAGLGMASQIAAKEHHAWSAYCKEIKVAAMDALQTIGGQINGDPEHCVPYALNISVPGINSEAAMLALKGTASLSNGSACTSSNYQPSHVLSAMGFPEERIQGALRFSWCHLTPQVDWQEVVDRLRLLF